MIRVGIGWVMCLGGCMCVSVALDVGWLVMVMMMKRVRRETTRLA